MGIQTFSEAIGEFNNFLDDMSFDYEFKDDYHIFSFSPKIDEMLRELLSNKETVSFSHKELVGHLDMFTIEFSTQSNILYFDVKIQNRKKKAFIIDSEHIFPLYTKNIFSENSTEIKLCLKCGSVIKHNIENDICHSCLCKKDKAKTLVVGGVTLHGKDVDRHIAYEKRVKQNKEDVKNGLKFFCKHCKKYIKIDYLAKNKKNSCTRCVKRILDHNEAMHSPSKDIKIIKENEKNMTQEDKAKKASSEADMIAQFLKNKKENK